MALTVCNDCGKEISAEAPARPKCGKPPAATRSGGQRLAAVLIVLFVVALGITAAMDLSNGPGRRRPTRQTSKARLASMGRISSLKITTASIGRIAK
jgi:hypothetical protein